MRPRLVFLSALAAAATATVIGSGLSAAAGGQVRARALPRGVFTVNCRFSHRNTDDLIVYPGRPGLSHDHTYFANNSTNAFSTIDSLKASTTTCNRPADTAAYWVPTLLVAGQPVEPVAATIYYRRRTFQRVQPFPVGLKMIAGDSHATAPQSLRLTNWNCGGQSGVAPSSTVPTCPAGGRTTLRLVVNFANCWDGTNLDSADHKSHMAYSNGRQCPASHPVEVPAISLHVRYPVQGGPAAELSSVGQFSAHADFVNSWNQNRLRRLVNRYLNHRR